MAGERRADGNLASMKFAGTFLLPVRGRGAILVISLFNSDRFPLASLLENSLWNGH
jgi:hypothetical protein